MSETVERREQTKFELARNYSLSSSFDIAKFEACNKAAVVGRYITCLQETASTQTLAKQLAVDGAPTGTLVIADRQTNGRGRNQRSWVSSATGNLYMSLILRPKSLHEVIKLNLGFGLAIARTARAFGAEYAGVKWPNDVWSGNKKLSGVLVDCDSEFLIVGIGVNLNEEMTQNSDASVPNIATSVGDLSGSHVQREKFLARLCFELETVMAANHADVLAAYRSMDILANREVVVMPGRREDPDQFYTATAVEVADDGRMKVLVSGVEKLLSAEEISIRPHLDLLDSS